MLWHGRYNLIGKTSALTFNVAAVLRNWILIFLSSVKADRPHTVEYPLVSAYPIAVAFVPYGAYS